MCSRNEKAWVHYSFGRCVFYMCVGIVAVCVYADGVPIEETCHLFLLCWEQQEDRQKEKKRKILYDHTVCDCNKLIN